MLGLIRQLHPRAAVVLGGSAMAVAGMSALRAWLDTVPPRDQLLHLTGQVQELRLRNPNTGAFTITLLSAGALHTFDFNNARRLAGLPSWKRLGDGRGEITATLSYFAFGRGKKVVDVVLGKDRVLSYDEVARRAAEEATKYRHIAIGLGVMGALQLALAGLARLVRGSSHQPAAPNTSVTLFWLTIFVFGVILVVMLS